MLLPSRQRNATLPKIGGHSLYGSGEALAPVNAVQIADPAERQAMRQTLGQQGVTMSRQRDLLAR